jgi:hypothetical protein
MDFDNMGCGGELLEDRRRLPRRLLRAKSSFTSHVSSTFMTCSLNVGSSIPASAANDSSDCLLVSCLEATFVLFHLLNRRHKFKNKTVCLLSAFRYTMGSQPAAHRCVLCGPRIFFLRPAKLTCIMNHSSLILENTSC